MAQKMSDGGAQALLAGLLSLQKGQLAVTEPGGKILSVTGQDLLAIRAGDDLFEVCVFLIGMEPTLAAIARGRHGPFELDQLVVNTQGQNATLRLRVDRFGSQNLLLVSLENSRAAYESTQAQVQARNEISLASSLLRDARFEADRANKAKTGFLSTITHELRTPLSIIIGNAELLAANRMVHGDEDLRQSVEDVSHYAHYMLQLVGDLLDLAKAEAGKLTVCLQKADFRKLVQKLGRDLKNLAQEKGICFTLALEPTPVCRLDSVKIQQVISNLIFNAIKFTAPDGRILVQCWHDTAAVVPELVFKVSDTGRGMSAADLACLGKPFTQFDTPDINRPDTQGHDPALQSGRGTGLGLALVKSIVGLHDGHFGVESSPGKGTEVTVRIPVI